VRRALALAVALAALAPAGASAHVTISPTASRPGDLQRYRLLVPNESTDGKATTGVDVQLPKGVTFALVREEAPWRFELVRRGSAIAEVRWRGGRIPPDGYAELYLVVRNPVRAGPATFKTLQRYAGGEVVRWIGAADSDNPAPTVRVAEGVTPQDVVSVHGGDATAAAGAGATGGTEAPAEPAAERADGGHDGDALAVAALVVALLAALLAGAALRRRAA
jgi:uncharacterized protein YcnI